MIWWPGKWARMIEMVDELAPGAVRAVEQRYAKGKSPGNAAKQDEAIELLLRRMDHAGFRLDGSDYRIKEVLKTAIEVAHATESQDATSHYNELPGAQRPVGRHG